MNSTLVLRMAKPRGHSIFTARVVTRDLDVVTLPVRLQTSKLQSC